MGSIAKLVAAAAAVLFTKGAAMACDIVGPLPTMDEFIAASPLSFVGTVVGFRTTNGAVVTTEEELSACTEACLHVVSVVFDVEHAIAGIEAGRRYETGYEDTSCGPAFRIGARILYTPDLFGTDRLAEPATPEQLAHWRSLVPSPPPRPDDFPSRPHPDCIRPPEEMLAELAPFTADAARRESQYLDVSIVRILMFRLDDSTLTADTTPCADQASPACAAFKNRIVSIVTDTEKVFSGERALGEAELGFRDPWFGNGLECHLPTAGQRFLVGGYQEDQWWRMRSPFLLLTD